MQVKIPVCTPVLRLPVLLVFTDIREVADHNRPNTLINTPLNEMFGKSVEVVSAASRFLLVQSRGFHGVRIVTASNPLAEVVVILLQTVERVQFAVTVFVGKGGEVFDTEVNTNGFVTGRFNNLDFNLAHEVQFPLVTRPDGSNLLDALYGGEVNIGASLVFAEDEVRPILLEVRSFAESNPVVLGVEFESTGFERDRASRVFVVVFAVLRWVCSRISVASFSVPAVECFSEFLKDSLT